MALADLAYGANQTIQQLLLERELEKMGVSPAQLAQRNQARQDAELALRQQDLQQRQSQFDANQKRQAALDQEAAQSKARTEATALGDQIPPQTFLGSQDPGVGMLQSGGLGSLLQPATYERPAMGPDFTGPMQTGETPTEAQTGKQRGFLKTASEKQRTTAQSEADRQQAHADSMALQEATQAQRGAAQQSLDAYRQAMLQRQPQGRETFEEWKRKQDYAAGLKQEQPAKLNQRDNDTVVTIHQMMPRINEVIGELKKSTANQPPPKPGLLGAVSQLGQKVERVGQGAAYKMGLAQPADISKRIQLESLMQVLGTVPYLRGTRNYQFIQQIQQHLADPTATDAANLERLQQLQRILPEMEQAIYDVENKGVIPHEHGANYTGAAPAGGSGFSVRELP